MRAILCICALAIIFEAVIGLPFVDTDNEFDDVQDMTKRAVEILAPSSHYLLKRDDRCPVNCVICFKYSKEYLIGPCLRGCRGGDAADEVAMWNRCRTFREFPYNSKTQ